jgi:hypothetical protein
MTTKPDGSSLTRSRHSNQPAAQRQRAICCPSVDAVPSDPSGQAGIIIGVLGAVVMATRFAGRRNCPPVVAAAVREVDDTKKP